MNALILFAQDNVVPEIFTGMATLMIVFWIIGILATIFWVWMLVDALVSQRSTEEKILWFLVIFFLHFIGALVYFFVARGSPARTT